MDTPKISRHARERCAEMGISTKRAKRIVQNPSMKMPGNPAHGNGALLVFSLLEPDYFVAWNEVDNVVLTVQYNTREVTVRTPDGGYRLITEESP